MYLWFLSKKKSIDFEADTIRDEIGMKNEDMLLQRLYFL